MKRAAPKDIVLSEMEISDLPDDLWVYFMENYLTIFEMIVLRLVSKRYHNWAKFMINKFGGVTLAFFRSCYPCGSEMSNHSCRFDGTINHDPMTLKYSAGPFCPPYDTSRFITTIFGGLHILNAKIALTSLFYVENGKGDPFVSIELKGSIFPSWKCGSPWSCNRFFFYCTQRSWARQLLFNWVDMKGEEQTEISTGIPFFRLGWKSESVDDVKNSFFIENPNLGK